MKKIKSFEPTTVALRVTGVRALSKSKFIKVSKGKKSAYVPYHEFMVGGSPTKYLREQKLVLTGPHYRELQRKVDETTSFSSIPLLESPGWTDVYFALPSGKVFSPPKGARGRAIFTRLPGKCERAGQGKRWREEVAGLVVGQTLPSFLLMAAFVAPILRLTGRTDNFGFEVVGEKATGKTTILRLMATVAGAGIDAGRGVYWQTLVSTMAGLETTMQRHKDLPLILDEAGLFMPKERQADRAASMVQLAFQLASGHPKARWGEPQPTQFRFIFVLSANEPASRTMQGLSHEREAAALDRLLTLPVMKGGHGVFDFIPAGRR